MYYRRPGRWKTLRSCSTSSWLPTTRQGGTWLVWWRFHRTWLIFLRDFDPILSAAWFHPFFLSGLKVKSLICTGSYLQFSESWWWQSSDWNPWISAGFSEIMVAIMIMIIMIIIFITIHLLFNIIITMIMIIIIIIMVAIMMMLITMKKRPSHNISVHIIILIYCWLTTAFVLSIFFTSLNFTFFKCHIPTQNPDGYAYLVGLW